MKQYVGLDVSQAETAVLDTATARPDHWSGWTQVPISDSDVRRSPTFITSPMTPPSCTRSPSVYHKRRELVCRPISWSPSPSRRDSVWLQKEHSERRQRERNRVGQGMARNRLGQHAASVAHVGPSVSLGIAVE